MKPKWQGLGFRVLPVNKAPRSFPDRLACLKVPGSEVVPIALADALDGCCTEELRSIMNVGTGKRCFTLDDRIIISGSSQVSSVARRWPGSRLKCGMEL